MPVAITAALALALAMPIQSSIPYYWPVPELALKTRTEGKALQSYRQLRDEIERCERETANQVPCLLLYREAISAALLADDRAASGSYAITCSMVAARIRPLADAIDKACLQLYFKLGKAEGSHGRAGDEYLDKNHFNLALLALDHGDHEGAVYNYWQALRIRRQRLPPNHPKVAEAEVRLAEQLALIDRAEDARRLLAHAVAILRATTHLQDPLRVNASRVYADLLRTGGGVPLARTLYREAGRGVLDRASATGADDRARAELFTYRSVFTGSVKVAWQLSR